MGKPGWVAAHMRYLAAMEDAFRRTGLDCSAFITDGGISIARKIRRDGQRLVLADEV